MAAISELIAIALEHHEAGRTAQAEQVYKRILTREPAHTDAWHLLGILALQSGDADVAVSNIRRALELNPTDAEAHNNLGTALKQRGEHSPAIESFRQAVQLRPSFVEAHCNLGNALLDQECVTDAIVSFRRALELNPNAADVHNHLGNALRSQGKLDDAIACYRRALELRPDYAEAHFNLGAAFQAQDQLAEAVAAYQRAIQCKPAYVEAHSNLGAALQYQGKLDAAACLFHRALELRPDDAQVHWNESLLLLLNADFERGWPKYEWRWKTGQLRRRDFEQPRWDGRSLNGQTILLHAEQGLGDTLQFIRYATLVKNRGGTILMECQRPLAQLLRSCRGVDQIIGEGDELPHFDCQAPLVSLPGIFNTSLDSIPADVPYLSADPALVAHWQERLAVHRGFRIGINWHGQAEQGLYRQRNIPLGCLASLAQFPGVRLISLQKDTGREELAQVDDRLPVVDLGDDVDRAHGAFMDTAAIMMNLDLVITSDTSIPHLAGALGVPVWVALPFIPDWRWLLDRSDSPWYPTMRLFRQKATGDWQGVSDEIRQALLTDCLHR